MLLIYLPTYYSKRQLYEIFCYQSGYKIQSLNDGSYIPVSEYQLRENDDDVDGNLALWPVGLRTKEVCSWATFLRIWKSYLPNLKTKPPSLDTCNMCDEYAKYMIVKKERQIANLPKLLNNDPLICPATN